MHATLKMPQSS